jgi:hypothetical protein
MLLELIKTVLEYDSASPSPTLQYRQLGDIWLKQIWGMANKTINKTKYKYLLRYIAIKEDIRIPLQPSNNTHLTF